MEIAAGDQEKINANSLYQTKPEFVSPDGLMNSTPLGGSVAYDKPAGSKVRQLKAYT